MREEIRGIIERLEIQYGAELAYPVTSKLLEAMDGLKSLNAVGQVPTAPDDGFL